MYTADEAEHMRTDYLRPLIQRAFERRHRMDIRCGVYILFKNRKPVYVGQARCIAKRLANHVGKIDFDDYGVIECARQDLNEVENSVITLLAPPVNQRGGERERGVLRKLKPVKLRELRA